MISDEWILIWGMTALTFIPRYLPMALASRLDIPPLVSDALDYVPIAVLTAIIAQTTFIHDGQMHFSVDNAYIYGAVTAVITAQLSRHLLLTITAGLAAYAFAFIII